MFRVASRSSEYSRSVTRLSLGPAGVSGARSPGSARRIRRQAPPLITQLRGSRASYARRPFIHGDTTELYLKLAPRHANRTRPSFGLRRATGLSRPQSSFPHDTLPRAAHPRARQIEPLSLAASGSLSTMRRHRDAQNAMARRPWPHPAYRMVPDPGRAKRHGMRAAAASVSMVPWYFSSAAVSRKSVR